METLQLTKPFKLQNGNEINAVQLDFDALNTADFRQVRKLETMICDNMQVDVNSFIKGMTLSDSFRIATGFLAAIKGTPGLMVDDFLTLPMKDTARMGTLAAFFWADVD